MTFENAKEKINSLLKFGVKPGLNRLEKFLAILDNPQDKLKFIHIAGTNGKGSVCTMIASALQENGIKTGLFTSPYIVDFRERFRINGCMIPKNELCRIVGYIYPKVELLAQQGCVITEFELVTAIGFEYFYRNNCDVVVLETGLGGRFDATNIIKTPLVSVITSISLDHTAVLGDSIEQIAFEKAGIIKENTPIVLYPKQKQEAFDVIKSQAELKKAQLIVPDSKKIKKLYEKDFVIFAEYKDTVYKLPFIGDYQICNALTALTALECLEKHFGLDSDKVKKGIENAKISARLEVLSREVLVILDGAHNPDGVCKLREFVQNNLIGKRVYAVMGIMRDKAVDEMVKNIAPLFCEIFTVTPNNPRALSAEKLCEKIKPYNKNVRAFENVYFALNTMTKKLDDNSALIICGSLYLAKEVKQYFDKGEF